MVSDLDTQSILGFALLAIMFTAIGEALRRKDQTFRIPTSAYFAWFVAAMCTIRVVIAVLT